VTKHRTDCEDAALVSRSLAGDREAFGQIVEAYQTLICSLAYSATGSLCQSEELAQQTFIIAWKELRQLREPAKLRPWLCSVARSVISRAARGRLRDPVQAAAPIESTHGTPAREPSPLETAISREEEAILWRSLERLPDMYREPLILFYREDQSVAAVAAKLDLSADAVKQRLSRGRRLLSEEVTAAVEGLLKRSKPGKALMLAVIAALPALAVPGSAATLAASAGKGVAGYKILASLGLFGTISGALVGSIGVLGAGIGSLIGGTGGWLSFRRYFNAARTEEECALAKSAARQNLVLYCSLVALGLLLLWGILHLHAHRAFFIGLVAGLSLVTTAALVVHSIRFTKRWNALLARQGFAPGP